LSHEPKQGQKHGLRFVLSLAPKQGQSRILNRELNDLNLVVVPATAADGPVQAMGVKVGLSHPRHLAKRAGGRAVTATNRPGRPR